MRVLGVTLDGSLRAASDPWNAGEVAIEDERIRVVDLARVFSSPTATVERDDDPKLLVFALEDQAGSEAGSESASTSASPSETKTEPDAEPEHEPDSDSIHYCAWLVDRVDVVTTVDPDALTRTSSRAGTRFVTGQLELDGERVVLLDERAVNGE